MSTVPEVLHRYGVGLTESDVAESLDRAFRLLPGVDAAPLTAVEVDYLAEHGGDDAVEVIARWDPRAERAHRAARGAADVQQLAASTLSIEQAAEVLSVDRSRISHRLSVGALSAVSIGSRRRIPAWQFQDHAELPHLAQVVAAIPPDAHPLDVAALMTTSQDELAGRTPVQHLAGGGDPAPVAELLAGLTRW